MLLAITARYQHRRQGHGYQRTQAQGHKYPGGKFGTFRVFEHKQGAVLRAPPGGQPRYYVGYIHG